MRADQIRDIYDQSADRCDAKTAPIERLWLNRLRQEAGGRLHGGTLEVAIGTGLNLPHYGIGVTHAVGIDLSSGMLLQAAMRSREVGRPIDLLQMDAERLAFADGSFDSLITTLSMCTVPRPEVALAEMMRVLRPGGRAVFLEHVRSPNRDGYCGAAVAESAAETPAWVLSGAGFGGDNPSGRVQHRV